MLDKKLFLSPTFFIGALIAFGATQGIKSFINIDSGNANQFMLELTLCWMLFTIGAAGCTACVAKRNKLNTLSFELMDTNLAAYLGSVSSILATTVGLIVSATISQEWEAVKVGTLIFSHIFLLFAIQPVIWTKITKRFIHQRTTAMFNQPKMMLAHFTFFSGLICLGSLGFHEIILAR
ncbi:hypothetical protein BZG00_01595 [Salinivibrio kushneri]|uniref:Uncharacterized protein n=1 Tax=Salinivibrio kushneri TaxID=1908198 RepID=A0AB36K2C1_9GAMM|nr:hypothetical protein [Salinivibrio kushneri]OOE41689.1 hypothetical protein BZG00_01595 [Salinivibrio kushneri]QCP02236.1 hypothetical protein FCN78_07415 [Salinivibrio kushneri]